MTTAEMMQRSQEVAAKTAQDAARVPQGKPFNYNNPHLYAPMCRTHPTRAALHWSFEKFNPSYRATRHECRECDTRTPAAPDQPSREYLDRKAARDENAARLSYEEQKRDIVKGARVTFETEHGTTQAGIIAEVFESVLTGRTRARIVDNYSEAADIEAGITMYADQLTPEK